MKWEDKLKVLIELLRQDSRVRAAKVVSNIGIEIASTFTEGIGETEFDAMIAAFNALAEMLVAEMKQGQLEQMYIRGTDGFIMVMQVGPNSILTISLPKDARMAFIFSEIKRTLDKIGKSF